MDSFDNLPWSDKGSDSKIHQHSYYDVDFNDDPRDVFYLFLNNINLEILEHELNQVENPATPEFVYIDPRTKMECPDEVIDHSSAGRAAKMFDKYPKKSCMSASQHKATIKYLEFEDHGGYNLNKSDSASYHKSESRRAMERGIFHEFMKEYCLVYFQDIYRTLGEYVDLYRKEFAHFSKDILSKEDELFSIVSGLPMPQNIGGFEGDVKDIEVIKREKD